MFQPFDRLPSKWLLNPFCGFLLVGQRLINPSSIYVSPSIVCERISPGLCFLVMAGWLSDEDLNGFNDELFMDLLEPQEQLEAGTGAKTTSRDEADLEQLSTSTEISSLSHAALTKHRKVSPKSATLYKRPVKVSKPAFVHSQMSGGKEVSEDFPSSQVSESREIANQINALSTKEMECAMQDIKKRVQMIQDNLTVTKSILSTLIQQER